MNKDAFINYIQTTIPNFKVSDEGLEKIFNSFVWTPLEKGEFLLKQGKISGYYVLLSGSMRAYTFNKEGLEVTTNFFTGPRVVFDGASFFLHQPSEESIVTLNDCSGYFTTFEKLNILFHESPEFREFGRAILVKEFILAHKQKLAYYNQSAEQRYLQLMQNDSDLMQVAQLRHIASYLGVTDTSLSRIRREILKK